MPFLLAIISNLRTVTTNNIVIVGINTRYDGRVYIYELSSSSFYI
jgi:hypothetical protein